MKITILSLGGHEFSLQVSPQEPVKEIKRKIEQVLGVPPKFQFLSVHGWELMDGLDMEDYPIITEGTTINLYSIKYIPSPFINQPSKIFIVVKFSARQIQIEVDMFETVRTLKEKIHIVDGTPIKRMSLFFSGVELEDDYRNIREYGIRESSEITVFLKTMNRLNNNEQPSRLLNIAVQTFSSLLNGTTIPLEMKDSSNVKELRELLLSRKILPLDDYLFIHNQRIMCDELSLRWHGVEDGDILYVFKGTLSPSC